MMTGEPVKHVDPLAAIRQAASRFEGVDQGTACNQNSFKTKRGAFLFVGPGAKGVGYKAMFKLKPSMDQARALAAQRPERFEVGKTGGVTVRFTAADPLEPATWKPWLDESYAVTEKHI